MRRSSRQPKPTLKVIENQEIQKPAQLTGKKPKIIPSKPPPQPKKQPKAVEPQAKKQPKAPPKKQSKAAPPIQAPPIQAPVQPQAPPIQAPPILAPAAAVVIDQQDDVQVLTGDEIMSAQIARQYSNNFEERLKDPINFQMKIILNEISDADPRYLPAVFKTAIPYLIEINPIQLKKTILMSELKNGTYQSKTSKSDQNIHRQIKTWFSTIPEMKNFEANDDLSDLLRNHRAVFYLIMKKAKDEILSGKTRSIMSVKSDIVALMRIMYLAMGMSRPKAIETAPYSRYSVIIKQMNLNTTNSEEANQLSELEKTRFLPWEVIVTKQKELYEKFNDLVDEGKWKTKDAFDLNLDLVLLSLYTLTEPLRTEPMLLEFKPKNANLKKDWVNLGTTKSPQAYLELNLEKKNHARIDLAISDELKQVLEQSKTLYPRQPLFVGLGRYPDVEAETLKKLTQGTVSDRLKNIFEAEGKNIGASSLRSSYVSYMLAPNPVESVVSNMATRMRTSNKYIRSSYRKVDSSVVENDQGKTIIVKEFVEPQPKPESYLKHNEKLKEKYHNDPDYKKQLLEKQKEYRAKFSSYDLLRKKTLSKLKRNPAYRNAIKADTLKKYNIQPSDYLT